MPRTKTWWSPSARVMLVQAAIVCLTAQTGAKIILYVTDPAIMLRSISQRYILLEVIDYMINHQNSNSGCVKNKHTKQEAYINDGITYSA